MTKTSDLVKQCIASIEGQNWSDIPLTEGEKAATPGEGEANSSFSLQKPMLQIGWDSTSLGLLKECARKYFYSIVLGYGTRAESVHLTFGILYHGALERYDHAKAEGCDHDEALRRAVKWTAIQTWNKDLSRPWISDDPNKNRLTLIRTIVWYCDQFRDDPAKTLILANGKPAVELSFRMATQVYAGTGEEYILCGHLDRVVEFNEQILIMDRKTTKNTINQDYFKKFSPDNQFSTYNFAGKVVYQLPLAGLIVDAAQIAVTFSRFQRGFVTRTDEQLQEWWRDTLFWIGQAERFAQQGYWPMNDKSCSNYGGCAFRDVCSKSPSVRGKWMEATLVRKVWDPLKSRGDI